jgi:hypothetical protein
MPFGATTVLSHSGASPGGVALLAAVPGHDLVFAAFGNDPRAMALHDQILLWLLRQHLNLDVPDLVPGTSPVGHLTRYLGTYRSDQLRVDVSAVDGQLEEKVTCEPLDETQERIFTGLAGGSFPARRGALCPFARTSSRQPGCRLRQAKRGEAPATAERPA